MSAFRWLCRCYSCVLRRYNVVFMFLTYFLPIGLMSYTYARVGSELWGSQSIGECTQRQLENIKSKRRVSRAQRQMEIEIPPMMIRCGGIGFCFVGNLCCCGNDCGGI